MAYLQHLNTVTAIWLPFGMMPLLILHIDTPVNCLPESENVGMGVVMQWMHMWFEPCLAVKHLGEGVGTLIVSLRCCNSFKEL